MTLHVCKNVEIGEHSSIIGGTENLYSHYKSQYGISSEREMAIYLPQDKAIPLLVIYKKDVSSYRKGTSLSIFIVALFIVARN